MNAIMNWIYSHHWAIEPKWFSLMNAIAERDLDNVSKIEALIVNQGDRVKGTHHMSIRDGVAIIPVSGPIFAKASMFDAICGATSTEFIARDIRAALENKSVNSILLAIDSPGGEVTGASELASLIYNSRAIKPIKAFVEGQSASLAYWIGSSASEMILANTAMVGSIGTVISYWDDSKANEKAGYRYVQIVSTLSPKKRQDPETDGRESVLRILDDLTKIFINDVARNRNVTADAVIQDFGQGDMFVGIDAVTRKMADRIGNFESVVEEMISQKKPGGFFMSKETQEPVKAEDKPVVITLDSLKVDHNAVYLAAVKAGAEAERVRIQSIESLLGAGADDVVNAAKYDGNETQATVAVKVIEAQKAHKVNTAAKFANDGKKLAEDSSTIVTSDNTDPKSQDKKEIEKGASDIAEAANKKLERR